MRRITFEYERKFLTRIGVNMGVSMIFFSLLGIILIAKGLGVITFKFMTVNHWIIIIGLEILMLLNIGPALLTAAYTNIQTKELTVVI